MPGNEGNRGTRGNHFVFVGTSQEETPGLLSHAVPERAGLILGVSDLRPLEVAFKIKTYQGRSWKA